MSDCLTTTYEIQIENKPTKTWHTPACAIYDILTMGGKDSTVMISGGSHRLCLVPMDALLGEIAQHGALIVRTPDTRGITVTRITPQQSPPS